MEVMERGRLSRLKEQHGKTQPTPSTRVYEEMSLWLVGKATEVSGMRPVYIETVMDDLRTGS